MKHLRLEWAGAFSFSFWTAVALAVAVAPAGCSFSPGAGAGGGGSGSTPPRITIVYPGDGGSSGGGTGGSDGSASDGGAGGSGSDGDAGCGTNLTGTIRDFKQSHPDFEHFTYIGDDRAIVTDRLGADGKPIYGGNPTTPTTSAGGKDGFQQWYHDVPGVNQSALVTLPLTDAGGGIFSYDNAAFFPIDNMFWGNEGNPHNFHFTYELHTRFLYKGGEIFHFRGDDDVFTYINGHLVVNLGGIHLPEEAMVDLDAEASNLGITRGQAYNLDFFFNERHQSMSNFHMDTTLFFVDCGHVVE